VRSARRAAFRPIAAQVAKLLARFAQTLDGATPVAQTLGVPDVSEQSTHKYSHLGSGAQKRLVEALKPPLAPHEREAHVNLVSTDANSKLERPS
jgi:hypothetical protein